MWILNYYSIEKSSFVIESLYFEEENFCSIVTDLPERKLNVMLMTATVHPLAEASRNIESFFYYLQHLDVQLASSEEFTAYVVNFITQYGHV